MAKAAENGGGRRAFPWRIVGWGVAVLLLLLPAVAMQFTREVNWDETDFIVMGALFGIVGLGIEFLVRKSSSIAYRFGSALAVLTAFLLIWFNLAVGMTGSEDNEYNLLFPGVIGIAALGAVIARFRPAGMARTMVAAGFAQAVIGAGGTPTDVRGGIYSVILAGLWLLAAALLRRAARDHAKGAARGL